MTREGVFSRSAVITHKKHRCLITIMKKLRRTILWIVLLFFGSTILSVFIYKWVPVYVTPLMVIRHFEQKDENRETRWEHQWVPLDEISEDLPIAVIGSEDQMFVKHNGFDFKAIKQAREEARKGKRERGASTISQQTAKNVFLWNGHSWIRKGLEAYFTVLIELVWGKDRIMEVYLNSIEMGDGIYGAEAVAQAHFNRSAAELTRSQCALIAATLPNPLRFSSQNPSPYMYKRRRQILRQMNYIEHLWKERHELDEQSAR